MSDDSFLDDGSTDFSAVNSILGFQYQIRYALYLLFDTQRRLGPDVSIDIERIDDIDVRHADSITKLVQTKNTATVLTNSSAPFWKTIRIWSNAISTGKIDLNHLDEFALVTTSSGPVRDNSLVQLLQRSEPADRSTAIIQMRALASKNRLQKTMGKAYQAFLDLTPAHQHLLVSKIKITTHAPTFQQLDELIYRQLVHGPPGRQREFGRTLFDRWNGLVEAYLRDANRTNITWQSLQLLLHEISNEFRDDNLPLPFLDLLKEVLPALSDDNRTFMRQLVAINATEDILLRAQRLQLYAAKLFGYWQRHVFVRPDEVIKYSLRLCNECKIQHESATLNILFAGISPEQVGAQIYLWAIDTAPHKSEFRIRSGFGDLDVTRGFFHELANRARLGWHPKWPEMFTERGTE